MHLHMPLGTALEWPFGVQNTPKHSMELKVEYFKPCFENEFSKHILFCLSSHESDSYICKSCQVFFVMT